LRRSDPRSAAQLVGGRGRNALPVRARTGALERPLRLGFENRLCRSAGADPARVKGSGRAVPVRRKAVCRRSRTQATDRLPGRRARESPCARRRQCRPRISGRARRRYAVLATTLREAAKGFASTVGLREAADLYSRKGKLNIRFEP